MLRSKKKNMLIIPAIHISSGCCTRTVTGEKGTEGQYPVDPAILARLLRGENAKSLHVVDLDSIETGGAINVERIRQLVASVDIPVILAASFRTATDVREAFTGCGVYRVLVQAEKSLDRVFLEELVSKFGPRRIVASLDTKNDQVLFPSGQASTVTALDAAKAMERAGVQRIVLFESSAAKEGPPVRLLQSLADNTSLSITVDGGVRDYRDLKLLQSLRPKKIDSIILDEALYCNAFPCQKIWRIAEKSMLERRELL